MNILNIINDLGIEVWAPIDECSRVFVSSFGRLINMRTFELCKPSNDNRGYLIYRYQSNNKRIRHKVHRLVAQKFIPNPENKPIVDHINSDKQNNHISNLRWATHSENTQSAHDNGLISNPSHLTDLDRHAILTLHTNLSTLEVSNLYGVSRDTILRLRKREYDESTISERI